MKILTAFLIVFLALPWGHSDAKEVNKTYVAKSTKKYKKSIKKRKKKYRYIGARDVNRAVSADYLKLKSMVRDLDE